MSEQINTRREGSLEAPTRHPLNWQDPTFYDEDALYKELERVYDICHGCRRCFNLCNAFPTLFDAIDDSESMELDSVNKKVYWDVVDHCYLCDMCFMTKCPYVPPHEWNLDFPHLMLRAKAVKFKKQGASFRDKLLTSTDTVGKLAGIPIVVQTVNAANKNPIARKMLKSALGVHTDAVLPQYHSNTLRKQAVPQLEKCDHQAVQATDTTKGRVVLFSTCYGNYNEPQLGMDLIKIFQHNEIAVTLAQQEQCCGMPKLELGDLDAVKQAKEANIPMLADYVRQGWDIVAPIPSCALMFKQELPLIFPDDADVALVRDAIFDPFEYLMLRHKAGKMKIEFKQSLGKIAYHVACHLRVQNIGLKTRDCLELVQDTSVETIERCSGHDGTYAVKAEYHEVSMKICKPIVNRVAKAECDYYSSDCPMAGHQIENGLEGNNTPTHPLTLLRIAYGL
ncbi:MAG: Fe-S oxidoreductase [Gammaproteobacteria bacterium]|nr:Fe-S oxidoreductase [Gammaproteobacteria bacterium]